MAHLVPSAKAALSYPVYACDFDPRTDGGARVVVGGGGGAGRSGVGNRITVFDASAPGTLEQIAEVDLGAEEDSVMSLAVAASSAQQDRKSDAMRIYAGVNSSGAEIATGRNRHLRVFELATTGKAKRAAAAEKSLAERSRTALFGTKDPDAYQRVVRLSRPFPGARQMGVVATGLAKQSEVVLFDATTEPPSPRGTIETNVEVADVDVLQTDAAVYMLAYCTDHEVYTKVISKEANDEQPACIYTLPQAEEGPSTRGRLPAFRALRWLTKDFICILTNILADSAVSLQIFRVPAEQGQTARISQTIRLPRHVTKATALATAILTPPATLQDRQGPTQIVVAVAGHDSSILLYKIDLQTSGDLYYPGAFKLFRTLRSVHALQITSLAFSNFQPPPSVTTSTPQQTLKLASTSMGNSLVVHDIPLFPLPFEVSTGHSKRPRYVVALPSSSVLSVSSVMATFLLVGLLAFFIQAALELRGTRPTLVNAYDWTPTFVRDALQPKLAWPSSGHSTSHVADATRKPEHGQVVDDGIDRLAQEQPKVAIEHKALFDHLRTEGEEHKMVLIEDHVGEHETNPDFTGVSRVKAMLVEPHGDDHGAQDGTEGQASSTDGESTEQQQSPSSPKGKTWQQLSHEEKHGWKQRLAEAGHWLEDMPETVFKGVLFGELGGLVGQMVAGG